MRTAGIVASNPQTSGSVKSAIILRMMKMIQKIFCCTLESPFSDQQHAGSANARHFGYQFAF